MYITQKIICDYNKNKYCYHITRMNYYILSTICKCFCACGTVSVSINSFVCYA